MFSYHIGGFGWHLARKLGFSLSFLLSHMSREGTGFTGRVYFFFRYLSILMHNSNLISNTDAKLLDSVIIVTFNKLELLLQ